MPRRPFLHALPLVLAAVVLTSAACSTASTEDDVRAAPDAPTELTVSTGFAIDNLDPLQNGFWAPEFGFGDLLMRPTPTGDVEPWVLQSLTPDGDTAWTLKLRPGVTFQDGARLDAANLAALMTYHIGRDETAKGAFGGATATAVDALTVRLTTPAPVPDTPSLLADESVFPLFDLATYRRLAATPDALVAARIYVGPYTVTSLTPERMQLAPTAGYYGGTPQLTSLTLSFVPDAEARIKAVQAGEADLALYPPTAAARRLAGDGSAKYLVAAKNRAAGGPRVFLNQRSGPLRDVRVRQAVRQATDYEALAQQVMNGLYDTSTGLYPSYTPFAVPGLLTTDIAAANGDLDAAGWTRGADGVRTKDGEKLALTVLTYPQQPDVGVLAVAWQSQLKAVGIDLRIREVDDIEAALGESSGWDLGLSNYGTMGMTGTDPVGALVNCFAKDGECNYGGVDDPTLQALITKVRALPRGDERDDLLRQAQRRIVGEQAYGWFLAYKRTPVVVAPDLADYPVPVANLWLTPYS